MAEWQFPKVRVTDSDLFVEIEKGYIAYGYLNEFTVERVAHFISWDAFREIEDVRVFAQDFLKDIKSNGLWVVL